MPSYGRKSKEVRATLAPALQRVFDKVIKIKDHSLIEGHRTEARQNWLFEQGFTKVKFPNSCHNTLPSEAVDAWPYVTHINKVRVNCALNGSPEQVKELARLTGKTESQILHYTLEEFHTLNGVIMAVAALEGVDLRNGADWDGDGDRFDQSFIDLPHTELKDRNQG